VSPSISNLSEITSANKHYRIELLPPGGDRTDSIFLDVYLDELTPIKDPILNRPIGGQAVTSANMGVVRQRIDYALNYDGDTNNKHYETQTDADGIVHHRILLATAALTSGSTTIDDADLTLFFDDVFWGLTLGGLPDTTTDGAIIDGSPSAGVTTSPGSYNGSVLEFPNLLLQSLGNVSEGMNSAIQNMGDNLATGGLAAGLPGHGGAASSTRHVALANNDEQAALVDRHSTDLPDEGNTFVTVDSHKGFPLTPGLTGALAGKLAFHSFEATWKSSGAGSGAGNYADMGVGSLVTDTGTPEGRSDPNTSSGQTGKSTLTPLTSTNKVSAPPAPVIFSGASWEYDAGADWSGSLWFSTGIDCTGYSNNITDLEAAYTLLAIPYNRCSNRDAHFGDGTTSWRIANDVLQVKLSVHQGVSEPDAMHLGIIVIGVAKGP